MRRPEWAPALDQTVGVIAEAATGFKDDWWIIGSAAAALSGAIVAAVKDVDLLVSERDAHALIALWSDRPAAPASSSMQFRSAVFARFEQTPLPVEVMGGFDMLVDGLWRRVTPQSRERRGPVFTASVSEQIVLLEMMGRDKDRARIKALRAIS